LYFYRDQNKKEIDLIIHQNNTVNPIEIKKGASPKDSVKNFSVLKPIAEEPSDEDRFSGAAHLKTEIGTGAVVCLASNVLPIDKKNWFVPAWLI
jgi:predicted AAA+ superfamily ATPase